MEKRELEEVFRGHIPDSLFMEAVGYAERKQERIYRQCQNPLVMQHWYLAELTEEYVRSLVFSNLTVDICREIRNMEKEHPAKTGVPKRITIL